MSFKIKSELLKNACEVMREATKGELCVRIAARQEGLKGLFIIAAYDETKRVVLKMAADVEEPIEATIDEQYLKAAASMAGQIVFKLKDKFLHVKDDSKQKSRIPIIAWANNEIPMSDMQQAKGTVTVDLQYFQEMLSKVMGISKDDEVWHYDYDCVLLECDGECMKAVTANRRAISLAKMLMGSPFQGRAYLPMPIAHALRRIKNCKDCMLTVTFFEKGVSFFVQGDILCLFYVPEFNGVFPPYQNYIYDKGKTFLKGSHEDFLKAVSDMKDISDMLVITLTSNLYGVRQPARFYTSNNFGFFHECFPPLQWEGEDIKIKVNAKTLCRALKQAQGGVTVHFINDMTMIYVSDETGNFISAMTPFAPGEKV